MSLRAKRGNLLPIPEIASADFVSLAMTEWGCHSERSEESCAAQDQILEESLA